MNMLKVAEKMARCLCGIIALLFALSAIQAQASQGEVVRVAASNLVTIGGPVPSDINMPDMSANIHVDKGECITATWSAEIRLVAAPNPATQEVYFGAYLDDDIFAGAFEGEGSIFSTGFDVDFAAVLLQPGDLNSKLVSYTFWKCGVSLGDHNVKIFWIPSNSPLGSSVGTLAAKGRTLVLDSRFP